MNRLAIYLPTYHRPHTLRNVARNIAEVTTTPYTLYFGVEAEDKESLDAAKLTGHEVVVNAHDPGYSGTIQTMYENSHEPFWFHANDDFEFLKDWEKQPIAMFENAGVKVVGVKQREVDTTYSAICFARRSYIEEQSGVIDMPNRIFFPYNHNYQDTEFTRTAQARGVWASCDAPCIEHRHPGFTGGEKDETYRKNDATVELDRVTFEKREHLWKNL